MNALLLDAGNTRLKWRLADATQLHSLAYDEGFESVLRSALPSSVDVAYLACVAPPRIRDIVQRVVLERAVRLSEARTMAQLDRLQIAYMQPAHLGVDRFLVLLECAALQRDVLIVSVGTALTVDFLRADGHHRGGRIAPSPTQMRAHLASLSAALPASGGAWSPDQPFATDTDHALASGCEGMAIALITASLEAARREAPETELWIHGGGAQTLLPMLPQACMLPSDVVLRGLARWAGLPCSDVTGYTPGR